MSPDDAPEKFRQECGVFVTLNSVKTGTPKLRGCIGYPQPVLPLAEAVIDSAINAATADPRFPPVMTDELHDITIEVSVLTPPESLKLENPEDAPNHIEIGNDGLIVERGVFKGLLLPQVPVEWQWDEEDFLCQCCIKAGLPPDTWLLKGTTIYKFQAIVFSEVKPEGEVVLRKLKER